MPGLNYLLFTSVSHPVELLDGQTKVTKGYTKHTPTQTGKVFDDFRISALEVAKDFSVSALEIIKKSPVFTLYIDFTLKTNQNPL